MSLIIGDSLFVLEFLKDESVDSVVTDPPFGLDLLGEDWDTFGRKNKYQSRKDDSNKNMKGIFPHYGRGGTPQQRVAYRLRSAQQLQEWCAAWVGATLRILKPGGFLIAFGSSRTHHRLWVAAEEVGFEIRDTISWRGSNNMPKSKDVGNGWGTNLRPVCSPILIARKPVSESTISNNMARHGVGAINIEACQQDSKWPSNEVKITLSKKERQDARHPTAKPIELMRWLVKLVTPLGGVVVDPFCGTGATLIAAQMENMKWIGIDLNDTYVQIAKQRLSWYV